MEGNGFGLRIFPSGRKSWVFFYRFDGRLRRLTLGNYPKMSVAHAHEAHGRALGNLERGIDPGAIQVKANIDERKAGTIAELVEEFIEVHAKRNRKIWREDRRRLYKDVIPVIGNRKAKSVTRRDIIQLLDGVLKRGAPISANRLKSLLTTVFNFGVDRAILDASPCVNIKPLVKEQERERALSDAEIRQFWQRLDTASMDLLTKLALRLQLVTGQRSGEIVGAEWSEIDRTAALWTIPGAKAKNGITHMVPLSALALRLLDEIDSLSHGSIWVFPADRGSGHRTRPALSRALLRNAGHIGIEAFTPHDLRRTVRTQLGKLGVAPHIAERVINHTETKIVKTYDRYRYDREKRAALDAWARHLLAIVTGETDGNVVSINRGT